MPANDLVNREQQQALVQAHRATRAAYNRALDAHAAQFSFPIEIGIDASSSAFVDTEAYREARAAVQQLAALEAEYFRRLPRLALACCPLCEKPLYRSFDPFGLDGLWWRSDSEPEEPQACPHFCLLLGAVDPRRPASAAGLRRPTRARRTVRDPSPARAIRNGRRDFAARPCRRNDGLSDCLFFAAATADTDTDGLLGAHELRLHHAARRARLAPRN